MINLTCMGLTILGAVLVLILVGFVAMCRVLSSVRRAPDHTAGQQP